MPGEEEGATHRTETPPIPARPPRRSTRNSENSGTETSTEAQPARLAGNESSSDSEVAPEDFKPAPPKKTVSFDEVTTSRPASIHEKIITASEGGGEGAEYTAETLTTTSDIDGASLRRVSTPSELTIEDEEGIADIEKPKIKQNVEELKLSSSKPISVPHRPGEIDTSDPVARASVIDAIDIGRSQGLVDEAIGRKTAMPVSAGEESSSSSSTVISDSQVPKLTGKSYVGESHIQDSLESAPLEDPEKLEDKKLLIPKDKDEEVTQKLMSKEESISNDDDLGFDERTLAKEVEADEHQEEQKEQRANKAPPTELPALNKEGEEQAATNPPVHAEGKAKEAATPPSSSESSKTSISTSDHPVIPPRPVVPKRPSSSSSGRTATPEPVSTENKPQPQQQASASSGTEKPKVPARPARTNKFSSARAAFVANLESRLGKGPVPAPPPKPRHAVSAATSHREGRGDRAETNTAVGGVGLAYPSSFTGSRRSTTESPSEESLGSADLRRGRARGPRGRRLPTSQGLSVDGLSIVPAEPLWEIDNQGDLVFEGDTLQHPAAINQESEETGQQQEGIPDSELEQEESEKSDIEIRKKQQEPTDSSTFTKRLSVHEDDGSPKVGSEELEEPVTNKEQLDANGPTDSGYVSDRDD